MGFEVRWRVDPILTLLGWLEEYQKFFQDAARAGAQPTRITIGTYRGNSPSLQTMAAGWGLPAMEWIPEGLKKDGMHAHVSQKKRIEIYQKTRHLVADTWTRSPIVALCKEPMTVRRAVGVDHEMCNCGPTR